MGNYEKDLMCLITERESPTTSAEPGDIIVDELCQVQGVGQDLAYAVAVPTTRKLQR